MLSSIVYYTSLCEISNGPIDLPPHSDMADHCLSLTRLIAALNDLCLRKPHVWSAKYG